MGGTVLTVVGGGIGGLCASIAAAEAGFDVELFEAKPHLGGRAATTTGAFRANQGPHVIYDDGPMWAWLAARRLAEPAGRVPLSAALYFRVDGARHRLPSVALVRALRRVRATSAPIDVSFRDWAQDVVGPVSARQLANFAGVVTFDYDPGRLAAEFVRERIVRSTMVLPRARYLPRGWSTLVERLDRYARDVGVRMTAGHRVVELPASPVVLAVPQRVARDLLDDPGLVDAGTSVVCLDLGLRAAGRQPFIVSDLDSPGWVETFSVADPTLAPAGHHLVQAQVGARPGETLDAAVIRIEDLLDVGMPGWREREVWRRRYQFDHETGALDQPGRTWRDRPLVDRGNGTMLVNDQVAAPGLLSEVSHAAALEAIAILARRRSRADLPRRLKSEPAQ